MANDTPLNVLGIVVSAFAVAAPIDRLRHSMVFRCFIALSFGFVNLVSATGLYQLELLACPYIKLLVRENPSRLKGMDTAAPSGKF